MATRGGAREVKKGEAREGYVIEHPNRQKGSSKITKAIVVLLLLASVVLMVIVTIGGWETIEGAKAMQIAYILLYVLLAYFVARWNRGVLPVIGALAIILLIFAAVSGPEWYDRDKEGFDNPPLDESVLGLITFILVPVQVLLIVAAMRGFAQAWNVEVERPISGGHGQDQSGGSQPTAAQPA